jgi:hypothetical protein
VRGGTNILRSNTTAAQGTSSGYITAFNANGWTMGGNTENNLASEPICSWTFREQEKFFDVVTWTGNGVSNRLISHALGATPGMVIVKATSTTSDWNVAMPALGDGNALYLNTTDSLLGGRISTLTSTTFKCDFTTYNASGETYVAYLFAHDAGGFGTSGTDNVISCGSYTGNGSSTGPSITVGYEPQFLLIKNASTSARWVMYDVMRGLFSNTGTQKAWELSPNTSNAEGSGGFPRLLLGVSSTGFQIEDTHKKGF